jgi:glutathione S-transferase
VSIKLFEHPLSPYVRKVKIVLYEKGIPFERVMVEPLRIQAGDPVYAEFLAASPRLEVPCLVDGAFRCFDSTIIADYLDERWPDVPMLPKEPEARARARMVEELCDTALDAILWGLMEIRFFRRVQGEAAAALMEKAGQQLARVWDHMERALGQRPWMSGEAFGRADAALVVHVAAAMLFGYPPLERHAALRAWAARCMAVPSVQRDAADLAQYMGGDGPRSMRKGPVNRQYRDHRLEWTLRTGAVDVVLQGLRESTIHFSAWP